ncbi:hypothetical protein [Clostridium senegalense]|uniref:PsbP C-terminal domain-containing protein n=1 Tax=Clostridium senegalense TaxID=1465809 RepID=A0A6M0GZS1_9CLOT|nr:hypothetical protein [Clostridium senegalense]NEU04030.1 hypothetical protein [Clostridium senegalense]
MSFNEFDRKKTGLAIIMVGLMIMVIGIGNFFQDKLKETTLTQNNISSFKIYKINETINYSLPDTWINSEGKASNDIEYNSEFISEDGVIKGNIKLYKDEFKQNELLKEHSENLKSLGIKEYKRRTVKLKNGKGTLIEYKNQLSDNRVYRNYDYIINLNDKNIVVNFYMDDKSYKENTPTLLDKIVKNIQCN